MSATGLLSSTTAGAAASTWQEVGSPHVAANNSEIYAMTETSDSDVWAFGFTRANIGGTFEWRVWGEHWDGGGWTRLNTPDVESAPAQDFIWGASAVATDDVWIVGQSLTSSSNRVGRNLVEHWNGDAWSIDTTVPTVGLGSALLAVSARTATDVWAVGETHFPGADYNPYVLQRTAAGWAQVPFNPVIPGCNKASRGEATAVDAVGPNDVYVAGWCQSQPVGPTHGYVMHWNGVAWSLVLRAAGRNTSFTELATAPDGQVWVAGTQNGQRSDAPILWHGTAAAPWTEVKVRHSATLAGPIDALSVSAQGVVIAGQLWDPHDSNPKVTYALRLDAAGKWHKEAVLPTDSGAYARIHAATGMGTLWLGGTAVGGAHLDPQSLLARRD